MSTDQPVPFILDGQQVTAQPGESIRACAKRLGIEIPGICSGINAHYPTDGSCRLCVVEIEGERTLAASCKRLPTPGLDVRTGSERVRRVRAQVLELLSDGKPPHKQTPYSPARRFERLSETMGRGPNAASAHGGHRHPEADGSHPAIDVDMSRCILCTNCVRACRDIQHNAVIGIAGRGNNARIVFDQGDPLGESTCVACGECVQACPTGALLPKGLPNPGEFTRPVDSLCPYCGVGCQVTYHVEETDGAEHILFATGRDGPANKNRLCVKGRFGFDYSRHPDRLTRPLVRRDDAAKDPALLDGDIDFDAIHAQFREASWDEALDRAADGLTRALKEHGGKALAGFGSAKGSNEEAYLFQKLMRAGLGTNNVDHCTRLCHASSVAALMEGIGSGAVTAPFTDAENADVIIVIGARPTQNHPVAATYLKNAQARGTKLIVMDPQGHALSRHADVMLRFTPGQDVALLNAMLNVIVTDNLVNADFVATRVEDFAGFVEHIKAFPPEKMEALCGIDADTIRAVARAYATADKAMIFWGMGVAQHAHGTDNARCLIALALLTGHLGRPGTGLHPLRGQNNVQGASDAGLIPMVLPDYTKVGDDAGRKRFEEAWGAKLDPEPGLTVVEIMMAALAREIRAMYILGENPAMSDPDLNKTRRALASLDHLVVQDIFLTETAAFADVILPASSFFEKDGTFTNSNRQVQLGRRVLNPPGDARQDLWIVQELARRLGLDWRYPDAAAVFEEMRSLMPSHGGISHARLNREGCITYPAFSDDDPGQPVLFADGFPTPSGKGKLVPAHPGQPDEQTDDAYPFVLTTGRQLEHWHTGAITRRARVLDALEPGPSVSLNPEDALRLGLSEDGFVKLVSRRGEVEAHLRIDAHTPQGVAFMPFAYREAAVNRLTNPALDPFGKIAEVKYCAVKIEKA